MFVWSHLCLTHEGLLISTHPNLCSPYISRKAGNKNKICSTGFLWPFRASFWVYVRLQKERKRVTTRYLEISSDPSDNAAICLNQANISSDFTDSVIFAIVFKMFKRACWFLCLPGQKCSNLHLHQVFRVGLPGHVPRVVPSKGEGMWANWQIKQFPGKYWLNPVQKNCNN